MAEPHKTLRESVRAIQEPDDFSYALRNFIDRFRSRPSVSVLEDEPALLAPILKDEGLADAYLAAATAWLCQVHDLPCPSWVNQKSRILRKPWFAAKSPNLKAVLIQESPAAFRVRNLFVSANALSRA